MSNIKKGDLVHKTFKCTISKKFFDGTLVSQSFGTDVERVCDSDEEETALTEHVYKSTINEMVAKSHSDPLTKVILKNVKSQLNKEQLRDKSL